MATVWAASAARAADVVFLKRSDGQTSRIEGDIIELTGRQLVLRTGARDAKYSLDRIARFQVTQTASHLAAEKAMQNRQWQTATASLQRAARDDERTWMRRRIYADLSLCLLNSGDIASAVENFSIVTQSDPTHQYFDRIPLAWSPKQLDGNTAAQVPAWLQANSSVKRLMGASWALATQSQAATQTLQSLLVDKDVRVAALAEAQLWRTRVVVADANEVQRWQARVRQFPSDIQPGPSYIVGQALARLSQWEDAAVALMRAPIQQPAKRELASQGLLAAGGALQQLKRDADAARVYQELVTNYDGTDAAQLAKARMNSP